MSTSGIARFTWVIWPWMNWVVPAFVCLHGLLGNGGWESLVLIPASVVLVPGTALLGALPRFLLRRRGYASAPLPMVPLLFVVWWGWICVGAAMPGTTDSAPLPSILNALAGERLPSAIETGLMIVGAVAATLSWVAVLTIALVLVRQGRTGTAAAGPHRASVIVAWAAAFVVPLAIVASCVVGVGLHSTAQDANGDTFSVAQARDGAARLELDRKRYEATQQALSEVRARVSPMDWTGAEARASSSRGCPWVTAAADCYALTARFVQAASASPDFAAIADSLSASGWDVGDAVTDEWGAVELEARSPDGVSVRVRYSKGESGQRFVNVTATSPSWWGSSYDVRLDTFEIDAEQSYAAEDFPRL